MTPAARTIYLDMFAAMSQPSLRTTAESIADVLDGLSPAEVQVILTSIILAHFRTIAEPMFRTAAANVLIKTITDFANGDFKDFATEEPNPCP